MKWLIGIMALFLSLPAIPQSSPGAVRIEIVGCIGYWGYDKPNETLIFYCRHKV